MSFGKGAGNYEDLGSQNRTAVMKDSKNGKRYFEVSFSDKETKRSYSVKVFFDSVYVPSNSKKQFRNGKSCCPTIVSCSKFLGTTYGSGYGSYSKLPVARSNWSK